MLEPDYLAGCTDEIVKYYAELEAEILKDVSKRIEKTLSISDTAKHQLMILEESGKLYSDIYSKINSISGISEGKLKELFKEAGIKSSKFDDKVYKEAGLNPINITQSQRSLQILTAGMMKTNKALNNLTMTMGSTLKGDFINVCDRAYAKLSSGAFTYQQAINDAVKELGSKGISVIEYSSGRTISLEAGIRRNVLTGLNQTTSTLSLSRAEELGADLVETTAHVGARPDHALWQGKVYSVSGKHPKYPDFRSSTGYGTVAGLCGANCRHNFFPFFEGISNKAYSSRELQAMNKYVDYNGQKMTMYEGEQKLRGIERSIRGWKRRAMCVEAVGGDASAELKKVREWQSKARDFCKQTGIQRDYMREKIYKGEVFEPATQFSSKYTPPKAKMPKKAKPIDTFNESIYKAYDKNMGDQEFITKFIEPHNDYIRALDQDSKGAIRKYTGSSYSSINNYLRGLSSDDYHKGVIEKLKDVIKKAPKINEQIVTYRRVGHGGLEIMFGEDFKDFINNRASMSYEEAVKKTEEFKKKLYNATYVDKGFCSTAYSEGAFGSRNPVQIKICKDVNAGEGLFVEQVSDFSDEAEFLYNTGTEFAIKDIRVKDKYLDIEVVVQVIK